MSTRVLFKCETFIDDQPAGPVVILDVDLYEADPVVAQRRADGVPGIPYGYEPQGRTLLTPWRTRAEARSIATRHGVSLEET